MEELRQKLNPFTQCKKYNLSVWQCPSFLFVLMGVFIIISIIATYIIARGYIEEPEVAALVVIFVAAILFIIGNGVIASFNRIAESNIIKSEFIRIISHHLRSPITALKWTISSLDDFNRQRYSEKDLETFDIIRQNTDKLNRIVNDLVYANLIETGRLKLIYEDIYPVKITERAIKNLTQFAKRQKVSLNVELKAEIPQKIKADSDKLYMILEILIDNAIRYVKNEGRVKVILEEKKINGNDMIRWSIIDNGIGIADEDKKRIFQKFFRASGAAKYQTSGTGLGLFNAKAFVESLGGKIDFESEEEKGSVFWFEIPIK